MTEIPPLPFTTALRGTYPKFPSPPRPELLHRAIIRWRSHELTDEELARAFERAEVEVVAELVASGLDVAWDGQLPWTGPAAYICRKLGGLDVGEDTLIGNRLPQALHGGNGAGETSGGNGHHVIHRFFDPACKAIDVITWKRPLLTDLYRFLAERTPIQLRPTLTGPYTLSRTIEPGVYENDLNRLGNDFALALNRELEGLAAAGAPFALLEEPLFMGESSEIDAFLNMIETAGKGLDLNLYISLDNLNREAIPAILEAPCAGLAFSRDIMAEEYRPILLKPASDGKIIEIGIISPRKPQTEDPDAMAAQLVSWSQSYPPELTWLSPASGLGGLTRESAYVKLENLVRIANLARKLIGEE